MRTTDVLSKLSCLSREKVYIVAERNNISVDEAVIFLLEGVITRPRKKFISSCAKFFHTKGVNTHNFNAGQQRRMVSDVSHG